MFLAILPPEGQLSVLDLSVTQTATSVTLRRGGQKQLCLLSCEIVKVSTPGLIPAFKLKRRQSHCATILTKILARCKDTWFSITFEFSTVYNRNEDAAELFVQRLKKGDSQNKQMPKVLGRKKKSNLTSLHSNENYHHVFVLCKLCCTSCFIM